MKISLYYYLPEIFINNSLVYFSPLTCSIYTNAYIFKKQDYTIYTHTKIYIHVVL